MILYNFKGKRNTDMILAPKIQRSKVINPDNATAEIFDFITDFSTFAIFGNLLIINSIFFYISHFIIISEAYLELCQTKEVLYPVLYPVNFAKFLRTPFYRPPPGDYFCIYEME